MKKYIIAIDGGTTNTRASLWQDPGVCVDMVKSDIGVRITSIEGSNASLKAAVKGGDVKEAVKEGIETANAIEEGKVKQGFFGKLFKK